MAIDEEEQVAGTKQYNPTHRFGHHKIDYCYNRDKREEECRYE
ncbi:MAG: hypothetical protein Q4C36_10130 [Coriobacteriia bacterium]|nr:hypothetical protein [Coriobacteriia bacterium]